MKNKIKRGALLSLLALMVGAAVLMAPTQASAYDGGSGGGATGGGGGGGWGDIQKWSYVNTWGEFENAKYMVSNHGSAANYVGSSSGGQGLVNICSGPNLVRIYFLSSNSGAVIKPNSGSGTFPWTNPAGGDGVDQYASSLNGQGVYVICVVNPIERITRPEPDHRPREGSTTVSGVTAWNSSVTPEVVDASGGDPIGVNNLNLQNGTKVTKFGDLANSILKSGPGSYDGKLAELQNAIAKDLSDGHATVDLNDKNKQGLAEGGVLSIQEFTSKATIALSQSWAETRTRPVTCDFKPGGVELASPSNCSYGAWSPWSEDNGSRTHRIGNPLSTPQNTSFYQIVSVHCNPTELASALGAYGLEGRDYTIVTQFQNDSRITAVIYTTAQAKRPIGADAKIFGVKTIATAALARTGELGFYDKECNAQCSTDPAGAGASIANGAVTNASTASNRPEGGNGGAVYDSSNSNYFELFRDNDPRRISVNTAYPVGDWKTLDYQGQAPIATTVTMWNGSTPGAAKAAGGGQFVISAVNGSTTKKLFTGNSAPITQTNFTLADSGHPVQAFSGSYATKVSGFYRSFDVGATWASEATKPVVLNMKWEYQPTTPVNLPANVGFTNSGQAIRADRIEGINQKIDVSCYAAFGDTGSAPSAYDAARYTGTGTTNTVDANILDAAMVDGSNARQNQQNLTIRFVRGVAE